MSRIMHASIGAALALATVALAEPGGGALFRATFPNRTDGRDWFAASSASFPQSWYNSAPWKN